MTMNRKRDTKRRRKAIPVWTYAQTRKAIPYLNSIMQTVREYRLKAQRHDLNACRLAAQPGRPDRQAILDHEGEVSEARAANDRVLEELKELQAMGVYCLDPVQGQALVPFVNKKQLAWFVYDLFDPDPLRFWRYHTDALGIRRPISEMQEGSPGPTLAV
jgi:hypothetical protein